MIAILSLAACSSETPAGAPDIRKDQQNEILIPAVGSDAGESNETGDEDKAYPDAEEEIPNPNVAEPSTDEAYPEPEMETLTQAEADSPKTAAYPDPQEEPVQEIKPTPRGNELVATDPSTVNLASGRLQLVEFFAFW